MVGHDFSRPLIQLGQASGVTEWNDNKTRELIGCHTNLVQCYYIGVFIRLKAYIRLFLEFKRILPLEGVFLFENAF